MYRDLILLYHYYIHVHIHTPLAMLLQNICDKEIDLTGSLLDTTGPFEMRNPLRELPPDSSHSLIIRFAPLKADVVSPMMSFPLLSCLLKIWLCAVHRKQ